MLFCDNTYAATLFSERYDDKRYKPTAVERETDTLLLYANFQIVFFYFLI